MFLSIKEMELRKVRFDENFQPGEVDFTGAEMHQAGPLHAIGMAELLQNTGGEVRVQGRLDVEMEMECDRCLASAHIPVSSDFDLFYRPMAEIAREEEVEIDEGEAEIAFYEGEGMLLEDILREQVLLALPMQHLCSEDCQGICPVCGGNRNEQPCDCKPQTGDDRWGALRNL